MSKNLPTIYTIKNSPYWYCSWVSPKGRKRCSTHLTASGHTKEQALVKACKLLDITNSDQQPGMFDLDWLLRETKRRLDRENKPKSTIRCYDESIVRLINLLSGGFPVVDVKRFHVGELQDALLAKKNSPAYINKICRHIRAALNRLYDDEIIERNPFRKFKALSEWTDKAKHLTHSQAIEFLAVVRDWQPPENFTGDRLKREGIKRLIYIYLFTGRRLTEILTIERSDVDLARRTVLAVNNKQRRHVKESIDIPPMVLDDFAWFLDNFRSDKPFRIFHRDTVSRQIKSLMRLTGLPESIKPHSLRNTFTTLAIESGENIWKIKSLLGHSSITVTEGYTHSRPSGYADIGINLDEHR